MANALKLTMGSRFACIPRAGCTGEVAKHERSIRVAQGNGQLVLWLSECLATSYVSASVTQMDTNANHEPIKEIHFHGFIVSLACIHKTMVHACS